MGILEKLFPAKTAITSATIKAEIGYSEAEITRLNTVIGPKIATIATLTDAEHVKIESDIAATKRAITRLDARIARLQSELPTVLAAEEAVAKAESDKALKDRAEASRKANTVESKQLLAEYDRLGSQMGDIFQRLYEIADERNAVNKELKDNPVADQVPHWHDLYRKQPDRQAFERRELRPVWVFSDGDVVPARTDSIGKIIRVDARWIHHLQRFEEPRLEQREITVERGAFRPGMSEVPLPAILAAGFSGGTAHWPRPNDRTA